MMLFSPLTLALAHPTEPSALPKPAPPSVAVMGSPMTTLATLVERTYNITTTTASCSTLSIPSSSTTNNNSPHHALSSLPTAAFATIYALIGLASLAALAALIYFFGFVCWPARRRRKEAEREAKAKLWWARRP